MSTDLESILRSAAKSGRLNHLTLAAKWDGGWEAGYRGVATDDHRIVAHSDPVVALTGALTGRTPKAEPPARKQAEVTKPKRVAKAVKDTMNAPDDNEDIL